MSRLVDNTVSKLGGGIFPNPGSQASTGSVIDTVNPVFGAPTNTGSGTYFSILGGSSNTSVGSFNSSIAGGSNNAINAGNDCFVGAGFNCQMTGGSARCGMGAGFNNKVNASQTSFLAAGENNTIDSSTQSGILTGYNNTLNNTAQAAIVAGRDNIVNPGGQDGGILCGQQNVVDALEAAVVAGHGNTSSGNRSAILAGTSNSTNGSTNCGIGAGTGVILPFGTDGWFYNQNLCTVHVERRGVAPNTIGSGAINLDSTHYHYIIGNSVSLPSNPVHGDEFVVCNAGQNPGITISGQNGIAIMRADGTMNINQTLTNSTNESLRIVYHVTHNVWFEM